MTVSTPASSTWESASASATVQTATASPAARAAPTVSADTKETGRWMAEHPRFTASATAASVSKDGSTSRPIGSAAPDERAAANAPDQNDVMITDPPDPTNPASWASRSTTAAAHRSDGSNAGSVGRFLISMLTTMPAQTERASASSGTWSGRSPVDSSWIGPTPSITGSWCTASPPSAVSRTSSSTPSAPSTLARAKASRVFSLTPVARSGLPLWAWTAAVLLTQRTLSVT